MRWLDQVRRSAGTLLRRESETARLDEEMRFHLEQEEAERIRRGVSPDEARRSARREFGNPALLRDEVRRGWSWAWMETIARDLRFAVRALMRSPGFTVTAVAVMALCIGATTCLFTIVRAVLLEPLPFRDSDKLVMVYEHFRANTSGSPYNPVATGDFYDWRKQTHGFEDIASFYSWSFNVSGDHGELPEVAQAAQGSWNLFHLLGVEPALGRTFTESEDRLGQAPVAVLTWSFFQRRFGGDRSIIGKQVRLDSKPYTIVGVLPKWFTYPEARTQLWVPYADGKTAEWLDRHDDHRAYAIARLRPDVSLKTAIGEVSALQYRMHMDRPGKPVAEDALARPMIDDVVEDVKTPLEMMMAAVGCMLMIGCLNVSNLLVARGAARQKEMAIRGALGAGRIALLREQMTETIILCAGGGVLGLLLALVGTEWLKGHWHGLPRADSIHVDGMIVLFAAGVVGLTAILAGLLPALSSTQKGILGALKDSSRAAGAGVSRARLRKVLLSAEIALTVVLLIAAGLLLKSFVQLRTTDLGIDGDHVLTMGYGLPVDQYSKPEQRVAFAEALLERMRRIPGVQAAGLGSVVPGAGWGGDQVFIVPERPNYEPGKQPDAAYRVADPKYFDVLKIPLIAGRVFDAHDRLDQSKKVIITKELAKRYYPGENPLGRNIVMGTDVTDKKRTFEIVGIVGDALWRVGEKPKATAYFPAFSGDQERRLTLVVRTSGDPLSFAVAMQKAFAALDPQLPVVDVLTIPQIVGESTVNQSLTASLVLAFAALSLLLAGVGLYGVLSYLVTQRVTEIGIRIALGAQRAQVLGLVLRDGLRPVAMGLVIGVCGGAAVGYVIRSLLYGTRPMDPVVLAAMVATLLLVAAIACAAPAWRASSVDPMQALRTE
ncbi:ABC transporter permease [Edaphobacter modestus]|uniref:Putative permease n=1 Tax=Edaphobacter modestus TaxID=388466 RepID=A0A4V2G4U6_9BACT|nr:ABC transporter permease [Edaphobacter modestus]RZU42336.1 putative permease [Edaphobacter modestus]